MTVRYERQPDHLWRAHAETDPEISVAARSLQKAHDGIREAVRANPELDDVELVDSFNLADGLSAEVEATYYLLEEAEEVAAKAEDQAAQTARRLIDAGLSLRDAAVILRCSHARVQQLLKRSST
jgi:hypothetical protein